MAAATFRDACAVRVLGPVVVEGPAGPVSPGAQMERALLAYLALRAGRLVLVEHLVGALWGETPPPTAVNALQVYVSHLRRVLGRDAIETRGGGYVLVADPERVDALVFQRLAAAGLFADALEQWRGPALADAREAAFADATAAGLEEQRLAVVEQRIEAELATGRGAELLAELGELAGAHPFRERLQGQLITALYRCGRRADALAAFAEVRATLVAELGIEPGPELQRLHRAVLADDPALLASKAHSVNVALRAPPAASTPLIGRTAEIDALTSLLTDADVRLVTLLGMGGTGKTRVAAAVARELSGVFPSGVCWVDLAALDVSEQVLPAVARALAVVEGPDDRLWDRVCRALTGGRILLVLDNCEHLPGLGAFVAGLLADAPAATILATSRRALGMGGEHRFPLPPLPMPAPDADREVLLAAPAAALLWERARAIRPDLTLTETNVEAVAALCRRLDGLPLALELAAARMNVLTPGQVLTHLDDRQRLPGLLADDAADRPQRHRSVHALLDWSHSLLTPGAQRLLAGLSVFRGGFDLGAATAVGPTDDDAPALDLLGELVDACLVIRAPGTDPARFDLLETVRAYAADRLDRAGRTESVALAHARHYASTTAAPWPVSIRDFPATRGEAELLGTERDNVYAAVAWTAARGHWDLHAELVTSAAALWFATGDNKFAATELERVVAHDDDPRRRVDALCLLGIQYQWLGREEECAQVFDQAAAEAERLADPILVVKTRQLVAFQNFIWKGRTDGVAELVADSMPVIDTITDPVARTSCLYRLGALLLPVDEVAGEALLRTLVDEAQAAGNLVALEYGAVNLAEYTLGVGDADDGLSWANLAVAAGTARGPALCNTLGLACAGRLATGQLSAAELVGRKALRLAERASDPLVVADLTLCFAVLAAAKGDHVRAAALRNAFYRLDQIGVRSECTAWLDKTFLSDLPAHLDPDELSAAERAGRRLTTDEVTRIILDDAPIPIGPEPVPVPRPVRTGHALLDQ